MIGIVRKNKITQYKTGIFVLKSKRAIREKNTWFLAQDYLGKMCVRTGLVTGLLSETIVFLCRKADIDTLAVLFIGIPVCQVISYIIPFLLTQRKLKIEDLKLNR
jgi:hypothetical protein